MGMRPDRSLNNAKKRSKNGRSRAKNNKRTVNDKRIANFSQF